ncbi:MAG: Hsp20/alpha crystallin family protein [Defluviitaleaceae bacterium]|nr:Hsp20/alpha crystallin family protein [Defluviitaleaceae bacterium]
MAGLIPLNRRGNHLMRTSTGFNDFYNMLDDFFSDNWLQQNRSLSRDTFKIDIEETETEYLIEAELPGIKKDDITLNIEDDNLSISVTRTEEVNNEGKNYIHRERRASSMSRRVRLANAKLDNIKAKLDEGILTVTIPKQNKEETIRKINIE